MISLVPGRFILRDWLLLRFPPAFGILSIRRSECFFILAKRELFG